ncbi:DUF4245 family protein [Nakamurella sp. YIM 132087]|uniref:DUF4245 family protein n=1 Tax=Nakamurella alba TaxID=2665158 RepID=A0A7K1FFL0_9ACTN|nr:DUF4245 domain-containing protein [Nakamurella alba]MTD12860.1 DUF4245 family protein [Nakamurella alba]
MADRRNKTMRDMALSMGAIVVVVLLFVGMYGGFSFSPGRPSDDGAVAPTADVALGFSTAQRVVGFDPLTPVDLPADWHPNSFTTTPVGSPDGPPTVRAGWLTPDGAFITLIQSTGSVAEVQSAELGAIAPVSGQIDAGGATWQVTTGRRDEMAWIRTAGGLTLLVTGSAPATDLQTLADSIAGQQ